MRTAIDVHIQHLEDMVGGDSWLDESFEKKLAEVGPDNAFVRPIPDLHSVAELLSHVIVWRISVLSILKGGSRTLTMESPENWKSNGELKAIGWETLIAQFYETQNDLIKLLKRKDDEFLQEINPLSEGHFDYNYYLCGIIDHDLYHLGQLGLTIKFLKKQL